MAEQNSTNHRKFYLPHHVFFYGSLIVLLTFTIRKSGFETELQILYTFIFLAIFMIGWLSFMLRQHYSLGNQDRIIRLEMRLRYFQLTNQRFEPIEQKLSFSQIAALRFASDEELPGLLESALKNNTSAKEIKSAINNWIPDHMRV
jgi:hypothetical protein